MTATRRCSGSATASFCKLVTRYAEDAKLNRPPSLLAAPTAPSGHAAAALLQLPPPASSGPRARTQKESPARCPTRTRQPTHLPSPRHRPGGRAGTALRPRLPPQARRLNRCARSIRSSHPKVAAAKPIVASLIAQALRNGANRSSASIPTGKMPLSGTSRR